MATNILPITIGYNPDDFFYSLVGNKMPSDSSCNDPDHGYLNIKDSSCVFIDPIDTTEQIWTDNSLNCYRRELCRNKIAALKINDVENNHLGSQQNFKNSKKMYNNEILKTFNLSLGILVVFVTIYYIK
jgi:hypothetical protein